MTQDPNHRKPEVEAVSDEHYLNLEDGEGLFGHKFKQRLKIVLTEKLLTFYIEHLVVERKFWFGKKSDCWYSSRATVVPLWLIDLIASRATPSSDSVTAVEQVDDENKSLRYWVNLYDRFSDETAEQIKDELRLPDFFVSGDVFSEIEQGMLSALRSQSSPKAQGVDAGQEAYMELLTVICVADRLLTEGHTEESANLISEHATKFRDALKTVGVNLATPPSGSVQDNTEEE